MSAVTTTPERDYSALIDPPGPPLSETPKWLVGLQNETVETIDALHAQYGDIVMLHAGKNPMVLVRNADAARHVLVTRQDDYYKGQQYEVMKPSLGLGLVTAQGETWRRSRRIIQPLFAKRYLGRYADAMASAARDALSLWESTWPADHRIDVDHELMRVGLDTVGRALVSYDFSSQSEAFENSLTGSLNMIGEISRNPVVIVGQDFDHIGFVKAAQIVTPRKWKRLLREAEVGGEIIAGLIQERIEKGQGDYDDLIRLLMEATDEETGEHLSTQQVIDEAITFIAAGHETTAHGLTWMYLLLAENPDVREKLHAEVDAVLQGRTPTAEDVEHMPYTQATFQEAMRIYPPVWHIPRIAGAEDELEGFHIRKGARMMVSIWSMHRDPRPFPDPLAFKPERWLDGSDKERPRSGYLPFSLGRRACVGQGFAQLNAAILTAMVSQRYVFDRASDGPIKLEPTVTLRPRDGIPMIARRRTDAPAVTREPAPQPDAN